MMIRVFIADNQAVVRGGLRILLESNPEIVVVGDAADSFQALQQVECLQPEVVIMDLSMAEMNGIDATQRILQICPEARVIILSRFGDSKKVYQALQVGAQGFLLFDSAGREVVEAVLAVYAGKVYLSQPVKSALVKDYLQPKRVL